MHSFICHNSLLTSCWCHSWRINILSILYKVIVLVLKRNNILFILHEGGLITSQNFINDISISSLSSSMNSNGTSISHHKSMFFEQYDCKTQKPERLCATSEILNKSWEKYFFFKRGGFCSFIFFKNYKCNVSTILTWKNMTNNQKYWLHM